MILAADVPNAYCDSARVYTKTTTTKNSPKLELEARGMAQAH